VKLEDLDDRRFAQAQIQSKKFYLQCVLKLHDLLPHIGVLTSDQPQSYYKLLLLNRIDVVPGLGDKEYQRMLKGMPAAISIEDAGGDALEDASSDEVLEPGVRPEWDDELVAPGPEVGGPPERAAPLPPPLPAPGGGADELGSDPESSSEEVVEPVAPAPAPAITVGLPARITYDAYEDRYIATCLCALHLPRNTCRKRRMRTLCATYGSWEPIAYLCAWLRDADTWTSRGEHMAQVPTDSDVRDWLEENGKI